MQDDERPWFDVTLRIWGESLPLDDIGPALGLTPSATASKGEPYGTHPNSGRYQTNSWRWSITTDSTVPFETQLDHALSVLEPNASFIKHLLSQPSAHGEFFLGYSSDSASSGATFSPMLLERVSKLNLSIIIALYPPIIENGRNEPASEVAS